MILELIDEAVESGARRKAACEILGLDPTTVQRWRKRGQAGDRRAGPLTKPQNALSPVEVAKILEVAGSPGYRDKSPKQIVPRLVDQGIFIASERSFYRVLEEADQLKHREPSKPPTKRHRPSELIADRPGQVWSWDITYLHSEWKGAFYYLYMVLDVWSRKIVGFEVHEEESAEHAARSADLRGPRSRGTPPETGAEQDMVGVTHRMSVLAGVAIALITGHYASYAAPLGPRSTP